MKDGRFGELLVGSVDERNTPMVHRFREALCTRAEEDTVTRDGGSDENSQFGSVHGTSAMT